jgi:hypothetical protein
MLILDYTIINQLKNKTISNVNLRSDDSTAKLLDTVGAPS